MSHFIGDWAHGFLLLEDYELSRLDGKFIKHSEPSSALITRVFTCAPCADGLEQLGEKADENWDTGIRGDDVPRVWILVCPIKQAFETADPSIHGYAIYQPSHGTAKGRRLFRTPNLSSHRYPTSRTDSQAKFRRII